MTTAVFSEADVRATYRFLNHAACGITEVRVIAPGRGGIIGIGYFDDEEAFVAACRNANGTANVYVGIQPRPHRLLVLAPNEIRNLSRGAKDADIEWLTSIVLDIDPTRPKNTASTEDELSQAVARADAMAKRLETLGYQRPIRNMSGNGCQLWLATPPHQVTPSNFEAVTSALKAFEQRQRDLFANGNVKIDSIHNLSRIIKVIGTLSVKGENTPERPHRLSHSLDPFVRCEDRKLKEAVLALRVQEKEQCPRTAEPNSPLIGEMLSQSVHALLEADRQLAALFEGRGKLPLGRNGKRSDMTSSGYDFSVALRLAQKGITDRNELATALWHRPDGVAREKGKRYIARTVARALEQAATPTGSGDAEADCIDFTVEKLVIRNSEPPFYHLSISGKPLVLTSDQFLMPQHFRRRFMEVFQRVPRLPKGKKCRPWLELVNSWLVKAEVQEQPPEASERGMLKLEIVSIIDDMGEAEAPEDLERGKTHIVDGRRSFRARHLRLKLREQGHGDVGMHTLCDVLRDLGCSSERVRFGGKRVRLWVAPSSWPETVDEPDLPESPPPSNADGAPEEADTNNGDVGSTAEQTPTGTRREERAREEDV
ncbi:MAG: hypothetical protein IPM35_34615 [Myxococcales bacterium]|nr:hypothetical protein [Myxococcales bacterium]